MYSESLLVLPSMLSLIQFMSYEKEKSLPGAYTSKSMNYDDTPYVVDGF